VTVLPADHHIPAVEAFTRLLRFAGEYAEERGGIVTLGVQPRRPSTGYGYIERGPEPLAREGEAFVYPALRFVEKPDAARAQIFVESGRYLWNAGIFMMPLGRISARSSGTRRGCGGRWRRWRGRWRRARTRGRRRWRPTTS
jgi:mannose-1-phosphate guanylyltransferase